MPGASRRRAPARRGVSDGTTRLAVRSTTRVPPVRGAVPPLRRPGVRRTAPVRPPSRGAVPPTRRRGAVRSGVAVRGAVPPRMRRPAARCGAGRPALRGAVAPARAGPDVRGAARLTAPRRVGGAAPALPAPAGRAGRARWAWAGRARWAWAGRARWAWAGRARWAWAGRAWAGRARWAWAGRARWAWAGRARWAWAGRARWAWAGRARWAWAGRARWAWAGRARWAWAGGAPRCRVRPCSAEAPAGTDQMARTRTQSAGARRFMAIPLPPGDPLGPRSGSSSVMTSMLRANCRFRPDSAERLPGREPSAADAAPGVPAKWQGVRLRARSPAPVATPRSTGTTVPRGRSRGHARDGAPPPPGIVVPRRGLCYGLPAGRP